MTKLDGGYGWIIVLSCFYGQLTCAGFFFSAGVFYPSWVHDFESSRGLTSWVVALCVATCNGFGPVIASLVARYGHRPVIMAGGLLSSCGVFLSAFATSVYLLMIFIGLMGGFGLGMLYLPSNSVIPHYFHKRRSLALGIVLCGTGLGNFIYPPFLAWLEDRMHWRGSLILVSGIMLQMVVFGALIPPVDSCNLAIEEEKSGESCSQRSKDKDVSIVSETRSSDLQSQSAITEIEKTSENKRFVTAISQKSAMIVCEENNGELSVFESSICVNAELDPYFSEPKELGAKAMSLSGYYTSDTDKFEKSGPNFCDSFYNLRSFYNDDTRSEQPVPGSSPNSCEQILQISFGTEARKQLPSDSSNCSGKQASTLAQESFTPLSCCISWFAHLKDTMLLLKNSYFAVFAVSNFLTYLTFLMPPVYMADRAIENGVEKDEAALALSMYGAGNLFGRLGFGIIADNGFLDPLTLNAICLIICGASTCLSPLCGANVILHGFYGFTFGTFIGGMIILSPFFLVELLGVTKLNSSLGLIFMFRSIGMVLGTPVAGWIYDASSSYTASFIIHGAIIGVSGLVLVGLKVAVVRFKRRAADVADAAVTSNAGVNYEVFDTDASQAIKSCDL